MARSSTVHRRVFLWYATCSRLCRLLSEGGDAVDFHQGISRQRGHRDGCPRRATVREVGREHLVHSIPVFNLHQEYVQLKNGVHGSTADFNVLLDLVHDHRGMGFDRPLSEIPLVVSALPRDIDQTMMDNHRHNYVFLAARFAVAIQFADSANLGGGTLSQGTAGQRGGRKSQRGKYGSAPRGKYSASECRAHVRSPSNLAFEIRAPIKAAQN